MDANDPQQPPALTIDANTMAGWAFSADEIRAATRGERLLNPSIDLSNPCNLNCPYCFIEEKNSARKIRFPDELTLSETLAIIADFASAGARTVNLVGAGEPTIDPAFEEVVSAVYDHDMVPVVFTNGIRLAESMKTVDFLYSHNATVVLKYNSRVPDTQDSVAGRRGYAQIRDKALQMLVDRGFAAHMPTRLALDIMAFCGNLDEIPALHRKCRAEGLFPIVADFIPTGRTEHGQFVGDAAIARLPLIDRDRIHQLLEPLSSHQRNKLFTELSRIHQDEFGIHRENSAAYYSGAACTQILGVYVDIHGNIWPCVARARVENGALQHGLLGNVRAGDQPSQVWRTDPYLRMLRTHFSGSCPYKAQLTTATPALGERGT